MTIDNSNCTNPLVPGELQNKPTDGNKSPADGNKSPETIKTQRVGEVLLTQAVPTPALVIPQVSITPATPIQPVLPTATSIVESEKKGLNEKFNAFKKDAAGPDFDPTGILDCGFTDKQVLEIAEIHFRTDKITFVSSFENYGIKDDAARLNFARGIAAEQPTLLCRNFESFNITQEKDRIDLAKICAASTKSVSGQLPNFAISDEQARFEIAKIAVVKFGKDLALNMDNYNLSREEDRAEIAKIFAANSGDATTAMYRFAITNENTLFEIAKIAAAAFPKETMDKVDRYNLSNELHRAAIAKICAAKLSIESFDIAKFDLTDKQAIIDIAKIYAAKDGLGLARNMNKFGITDALVLASIIHITVKDKSYEDALAIYTCMDTFTRDTIESMTTSQWQNGAARQSTISKLRKSNLAEGVTDNQQDISKWIEKYDRLISLNQFTEEQLDAQYRFAEQILKLRDPELRMRLLYSLILIPLNVLNGIHAKDESCLLFHMMLCSIKTDNQIDLSDIAARLSTKEFQDAKKKKQALWTLDNLQHCDQFNFAEKIALLKNVFDIPNSEADQKEGVVKPKFDVIVERLKILNTIILASQTDCLKKTAADGKQALDQPINLQASFNKVVAKILDVAHIPDLQRKYSLTISKGRDPLALLIYAGKLSTLDVDGPKADLREFTTAVLNGNYHEWRNSTKGKSHLSKISLQHPKVWSEWQKGASMPLEELSKESSAKTEENLIGRLKDNLMRSNYLNQSSYPHLAKWLNPASRSTVKEEITKKIKENLPKKGEKKPGPGDLIYKLKFEETLINLLASTSEKTDAQWAGQMIKLSEARSKDDSQEFVNDLGLLKKDLESNQKNAASKKSYTVVDTDEWDDMLLSGTEVADSCQSVYANTLFNKCLVGYLNDAKNRIIAVKNSDGQIVARCIVRLLWDDVAKKPVVFQENIYKSPGMPPEARVAINKFCKNRAEALGLTLVREKLKGTSSPPYANALQSLGSASYEYVDANALGPVANGIYTLPANTIEVIA